MPWHDLGDDPCPPARKPGDIVRGARKIQLRTNYFEVTIKNPSITLVHYDVDIKLGNNMAVMLPKKKRMMIFQEMIKKFPKVFEGRVIGFDSEKNAYSTTTLFKENKTNPGKKFQVEIREYEKPQKFMVTMKAVNREKLSSMMDAFKSGNSTITIPQTTIQMLEVIFHHNLSTRYEKIGRNMFFSQTDFGKPYNLGGGKEILSGLFGSLRPAWKDNSMLLNVDVVNAAFYKEQSVIEFITKLLDISEDKLEKPFSTSQKRKVDSSLKKIKVRETHSGINRTYKVVGVAEVGADEKTINFEDKKCTIQQYFAKRYQKTLHFPKLNLLQVGVEAKNVFLPIECCKIAKGQKVQGKLSDRETSQFIRNTAKSPSERLQHITRMVQKQQFSKDKNIQGLELSISDMPVSLEGHVLDNLQLCMSKEFVPVKGVWDTREKTFFEPEHLKCWAVLNYSTYVVPGDSLKKFIDNLKKMGRDQGMNISDPADIFPTCNPAPEEDLPNIKRKFPNIQLIMAVLPQNKDLYDRLKKIGDRKICVVTQGVKDTNVKKNAPPVVGNLLLKINAKIGGVNYVVQRNELEIFSDPVMIMGADVNHPPAHDKATPSLAAVVASMNNTASKYAAEVRHQKCRTEMIQELKEMTKNLLLAFYRQTKRKPSRIVMFRDGVSESQFLKVLSFELKAMRAACTELEETYQPAMTFIVVQKRHHTRFFCNESDGVGKSGNVPPGTTVDNTITHPTQKDFYLCSHLGIIGTSRPTHYHVLWDDSDMSMEMLQKLTYAMCHLYSRCTRSVSIPTPAFYAHLVAYRAKLHSRDLCPSEAASMSSGEDQVVPSDAVMTLATKVDINDKIANLMYFI
ncbi:protein argonaute-2-like isoform X2 [Eriocheir sinensis]|uniref:protein argonaute-2-like isoform X2 n=1 Tax=Eriocheir sinensis TaxID=95602 RepID=UPI0021C7BF8B|nr:protein argonaute-2-like isoform X2 [Eriocheir sinensis]